MKEFGSEVEDYEGPTKCEECANRGICIHYRTMQQLIDDELDPLACEGITVELVVKECPYFRKDEERKPGASLKEKVLVILGTIKENRKEMSIEELLQKLAEKGIQPEEARKLIDMLLRAGEMYEPRKGYLKII